MIFASKVSFVILFLFAGIISTSTADLSKEHDITTVLNDTIVGIFRSVEPSNAIDLIKNIKNVEHANIYEYHNFWRFRFRNTRISKVHSNETRIRYGFHNGGIQIYNPRLIVHLASFIEKKFPPKGHMTYNIDTVIRFNDSLITAIALPNNSRTPFHVVSEYNYLELKMEGISDKDPWAIRRIEPLIPSIFRDDMNHNKKFLSELQQSYGNNPKKDIISKHPNFSDDEHRYYYLIPKTNLASFHLTNIFVRGLSNFHSLNFTDNSSPLTYTLLMKNIRGGMTLETGSNSALEFSFYADSLFISIVRETNRVSVEAQNYSFVQTKSNTSLPEAHSDIIIDCLESAIASSLMPSMEFQRTNRSSLMTNTNEIEDLIRRMISAEGK